MTEKLATQLQSMAAAKPAGKVFVQFNLEENGSLFLDTRDSPPVVSTVSDDKPQTVMALSAADLGLMLNGELQPMKAVMSGRMKISGNMGVAMKLAALFDE